MKGILFSFLLLCACDSAPREKKPVLQSTEQVNPLPEISTETQDIPMTFRNVSEIVHYEKENTWVDFKDSSASLALHFNLGEHRDTICVSYSPECWLEYPFKLENEKIIVYWDDYIDSKYDFDLVKAVRKIDPKYLGKPFMVLELVNDTTLKATYPIPGLIKKINSSSKKRTFFPNQFTYTKFYL